MGEARPRRKRNFGRSLIGIVLGVSLLISVMSLVAFALGFIVAHPDSKFGIFGYSIGQDQPPEQAAQIDASAKTDADFDGKTNLDVTSGASTQVEGFTPAPQANAADPPVASNMPDYLGSGDKQQQAETNAPAVSDSSVLSPLLRRIGSGSADFEISRFGTVQIVGTAKECLEMGYSIVGSVKAPKEAFEVLISQSMITIGKICAANGSVLVTCRSNRISISPRRARPDDGCRRTD